MKSVGDDKAGFTAGFDAALDAVRVRGWGFWNASVAEAFLTTVVDACGAAQKGTLVMMDMTGLKPLREEGQQSFGTVLKVLRKLGVARISVATASHLTKLQLLRIATEQGTKDSVEFTENSSNGNAINGREERTNR